MMWSTNDEVRSLNWVNIVKQWRFSL